MAIDRGSSKHNPRVDDKLASEVRGLTQGAPTDARANEWRQAEPSGEDQPDATMIPEGERRGGAPAGISAEEVEGRSQLGRYLDLSVLPATRDELLASARMHQAPDEVLAVLARVPDERRYRTVSEVWAALGYGYEAHR